MRMDGAGSSDVSGVKARAARRRATGTTAASVPIEVPFHDVDALGIVWHGHYYKYLEVARTVLLRDCRLDATDLRGLGFGMVMIESRCRHVAPLRYGDIVRVSAWFRDVRHRICVDYEIVREADGVLAARAETVLATVTLEGVLILETPEVILQRLESEAPTLPDNGRAPDA
jgi:acyl-CoA thioester hydrolase